LISFRFVADLIMNRTIHLLFYLLYFLSSTGLISQTSNQIPIGSWRDHLPLSKGISVAGSNNEVFCATPNGVIVLNKEDGSLERLSGANGLSDIGISCLNYHEGSKTLVIGYKNGNIDLVRDKNVVNFGDIKRSTTIQGAKTIYAIRFFDDFGYLCCNFGVVVLDMKKREVKTTFYPTLVASETYDITSDGTSFYLATSKGIYTANKTNPALSYYVAWSPINQIGVNRKCTNVALFDGGLYFISSKINNSTADTVFQYKDNGLEIYKTGGDYFNLTNSSGHLVLSGDYYLLLRNPGETTDNLIYTYGDQSPQPSEAFLDPKNPNSVWIADRNSGLVNTVNVWNVTKYTPEGPPTTNVFKLAHSNSQLWVATGAWDIAYSPLYIADGLFNYDGTGWNDYTLPFDSNLIRDIVAITIDPSDSKHVFAASYGTGVVECKDGQVVNTYTASNSSLQGIPGYPDDLRISGVSYDQEGRVWVANSSCQRPLSVRKADGTWKSFTFNNSVNNQKLGSLFIDRSGLKWMIVQDQGLLVASTEGNDLKAYRFLNDQLNNGSLSTKSILSIAEDKDGQIWVGTSEGVSVFYNPLSILEEGSNGWDSQKIIINQDGYNQYLLDAEEVTAIYVDGGNRKWFGTRTAGIFLVSPDGTEQLVHFTTENSPLLSNTINSLAMDEQTGELFIGTDQGICSYRSDATGGGEQYSNVYAFPNPVANDYNGPIAITGLVSNADVKITDVSGNLVFSTRANGGTALWNGKLFSGERAATGVYLVFCSNSDGSATKTTKIMFIN
jgi:ligand-binding sensor domain-containing protein